jgi:mRNA-degrading endonuclease RelE of RelBE toxin-antitoxin system
MGPYGYFKAGFLENRSTTMKFEIKFTPTAASHVRSYRKFEQQIILDGIEEQLSSEPTTQTRNRKQLGDNQLSNWELRVKKYRVFYDVVIEGDRRSVQIKAVGHKEHNTLYIGSKEVQL